VTTPTTASDHHCLRKHYNNATQQIAAEVIFFRFISNIKKCFLVCSSYTTQHTQDRSTTCKLLNSILSFRHFVLVTLPAMAVPQAREAPPTPPHLKMRKKKVRPVTTRTPPARAAHPPRNRSGRRVRDVLGKVPARRDLVKKGRSKSNRCRKHHRTVWCLIWLSGRTP
jgi:hypothetical protein